MLTTKMDQWRDGLLSDSEIIGWLLSDLANAYSDLADVQNAMAKREIVTADARMDKLGNKPFTEG